MCNFEQTFEQSLFAKLKNRNFIGKLENVKLETDREIGRVGIKDCLKLVTFT
jgi:hypothetical protein